MKKDISCLTWEAQSLLLHMTEIYIKKGLSVFFCNRTPRAELLVEHGFCVERFDNYTAHADYHSRELIIEALQNASIYGVCPSKNTLKRDLHTLIEVLEEERLQDLKHNIILLDLQGQPEIIKHEISGGVYMKYYNATNEDKEKRLAFLLEKGINPSELCKHTNF